MDSIATAAADWAEQAPDTTCLIDGDGSISRSDLWIWASEAASILLRMVKPADAPGVPLCALMLPRSAAVPLCIVASRAAGMAFLPLDVRLPRARLAAILAQARPSAVVSWTGMQEQVQDVLDLAGLQPSGAAAATAPPHPTWEQLAVTGVSGGRRLPPGTGHLIFTSGSSGKPKGVLLRDKPLLQTVAAQRALLGTDGSGPDAGSPSLWTLNPAFDASLSDIFCALLGSAPLAVFRPEQTQWRAMAAAMERHGAVRADLAPSLLRLLQPGHLPRLRAAIFGGERCESATAVRWGGAARAFQAYGPTEAAVCATMARADASWTGGLLGRPLPHQVLLLSTVDGLYRIVPALPGASPDSSDFNMVRAQPWGRGSHNAKPDSPIQGEIWLAGDAVAVGYLDAPEQQLRRFGHREGVGVHYTGDIARLSGGRLCWLGRNDRQLKLNGRLVCPEEVEAAAESFWPGPVAALPMADGLVLALGPADPSHPVASLPEPASVRLTGSFQDVTARVAEREALRLANERIEIATDSGGIGIWDWDLIKGELLCDAWMHRLHGKNSNDKDLSNLWRDHLHPEDKAHVERALLDAVEGRQPYDLEFRIVWQDGTVRTLRGSAKVTRNETGKAIRMVGANWDVTDSRKLTAQLAEQHEMLDVTLRSICDGVITTDADNGIVWMNPAAERWTGWRVVDAIGQPLDRVLEAMRIEDEAQSSHASAEQKQADRLDESAKGRHGLLQSRDGNQCSLETTVAPIRGIHGETIGSVVVFRDVSEQRRLAAQTQRVVKLKDEFLSHVSHELRSPLSSIYSFSSIIADNLAGDTTPQQQEYLGIVLKNVVQLQSMIEDLLTVTQSREGKLSVQPQPVILADTITDALNVVQSAAARKKISLSTIDISRLPIAYADPTRLQQVMIILLDNAIKFTPAGGQVSVHAEVQEPGFLLVQVEDSGCGIPADKRTKVFENLYQVMDPGQADTSQAGRTGLGLGLHIARNLVTRQGGYIWVTEADPQGSVFNFTLPIFVERRGASRIEDAELKLSAGTGDNSSEVLQSV